MTHTISPSDETASRIKTLMIARVDRYVSDALGVSRYTACRLAGGLPVLRAVVIAVESQLSQLEHQARVIAVASQLDELALERLAADLSA